MNEFDLVVAPYGDDLNNGTLENPLQTPERAKELLKTLKGKTDETITVRFREGTYNIEKTLEFTSDDKSNVIYRSYPNENVSFSGAKEISDWSETEINGVKAFVTNVDGNKYFNSLFKGDKRLSCSVYPKTGAFEIAGINEEDIMSASNSYDSYGAFYTAPANVSEFANTNDVIVRVMHYWCDELLPVAAVDQETGKIEVQKIASLTIKPGNIFVYENVREALSLPGEWYLDKAENKLYYIPMEGDTVDNTVLLAGYTDKLINIDGISDIKFQGIKFCNTDWKVEDGTFSRGELDPEHPLYDNIKYVQSFPQAAYDVRPTVNVQHASNVNFIDCEFKNISNTALMFGLDTACCTVKSCLFDQIGANAVYVRGANTAPACTHDITVTHNHIRYYGRIYNNAIGVLLVHAADCEISHNEIHDGWYTAISVGWIWGYAENVTNGIRVQNNLIYNIGNGWLSDMGGVYTLGIQPDTVISGNIIHDVGCYGGNGGYGGWGIYLDEGSSCITVEKNLVYDCSSQAFHQHYGKDNVIRNNIFAFGGEGQFRISRHEEHNSLYLYNNIFVGDNTTMYTRTTAEGWFKDKENLYWDYTNGGNVYSGDSMKASERHALVVMTARGYYNDAVFADPLFKDAKNRDFTLAENSPAIANGFEPWAYDAGTYTLY